MRRHGPGERGVAHSGRKRPSRRATRWAWLLLAAVQVALADAPAPPALRYTPQEVVLVETLDRTAARPLDERQAALAALAASPGFDTPETQALLQLEHCNLAGLSFADAAPYGKALDALLDAHPDNRFIALAQGDCRLLQRQSDTPGAFEARRQLHLDAAGIGYPGVRYRLASAYARDALAMGFVDESLQAVETALRIAEANEDTFYRRASLMDLALVRSAMRQHEEAIAGSTAALDIADGRQRIDLLLSHAYILLQAERLPDAMEVYRRARALAHAGGQAEQELTAMLNLSAIHARLGEVAENLVLTADIMARAGVLGSDYYRGYAANARAFALIDDGATDAATRLFSEGRALLEEAGERLHVANNLAEWAGRLAARGRHAEAYRALSESRAIDAGIRSAERERHARYLAALLGAGQKDLAIERLRRENAVAQLRIETRRMSVASWAIGLASVSIAALTLLLSYLRLKRSSRRLAEANARLDHENAHDALTGLHNRAHFAKRFDELKVAVPGRAVLALLDLDHFKGINDRLGHAAGDEVLREASERLAAAVRGGDLIARWGGEEFIVLATGLGQGQRSAEIPERLLQALRAAPMRAGGELLPLTGSVGYAEIDLDATTRLDDELEYVDAALYHAKRGGRDRAVAVEG